MKMLEHNNFDFRHSLSWKSDVYIFHTKKCSFILYRFWYIDMIHIFTLSVILLLFLWLLSAWLFLFFVPKISTSEHLYSTAIICFFLHVFLSRSFFCCLASNKTCLNTIRLWNESIRTDLDQCGISNGSMLLGVCVCRIKHYICCFFCMFATHKYFFVSAKVNAHQIVPHPKRQNALQKC